MERSKREGEGLTFNEVLLIIVFDMGILMLDS